MCSHTTSTMIEYISQLSSKIIKMELDVFVLREQYADLGQFFLMELLLLSAQVVL